ncbi:hypothetical protein Belba_3304 [Belliella baltica DSM 15883]|uniref:Uncharacterized protein n=1 Tax=Belliella baltica (strain DSM 15883 / CIP 108006 / LMG 21964 / BA134) TaxID=866536 RepID=I3Z993_BELBD|nr:hypothetical protein [Belliella baltica]AFL85811.1 hypothetical protein Belba_3304 [Belliella baltica DSM 15883]
MNEQELQVTLKDIQDVMVSMDGRMQQIEKQQSEAKDYSAELASINGKLEHIVKDETLAGLKASMSKLATASSNLVTAISEQQIMQETLIKEFPQKMKTEIVHRFTGRQQPYIITGIALVFITISSLLASVQLWRNNLALQSSDIKIRTVKLIYPKVFLDVDTFYHESPKKLAAWVEQEEARLFAIIKAEEAARQSKEKAERATERLNRLKKQKNKNSK